jgi:hypothetical protein
MPGGRVALALGGRNLAPWIGHCSRSPCASVSHEPLSPLRASRRTRGPRPSCVGGRPSSRVLTTTHMKELQIFEVRGSVWWRFVCRWIEEHHRHHDPPQGWRYGLVAQRGDLVVGVAVVGRAVARCATFAEVTRLCTWGPSTKRYGAASALLRAVAELEPHVRTYTLASEGGASLRAAGWTEDGPPTKPRAWSCNARPRRSRRDESEGKQRWAPLTPRAPSP